MLSIKYYNNKQQYLWLNQEKNTQQDLHGVNIHMCLQYYSVDMEGGVWGDGVWVGEGGAGLCWTETGDRTTH